MSPRQILIILLARKWLMLGTLLATMGVAAVVTALLPERYTATTSIVIDFKAFDPVLGNTMPAALLPGYMPTQLDVLSSHNVALKAVDSLKLASLPETKQAFEEAGGKGSIRDWLAARLLKDLKLEPSRESNMVSINFRSKDPQFAAAAANAIVQAYIDTNLELKVEPARQTTVFFNEQLQVLKANLDSSQSKLSAYQREKGITATDERYDVENARLAELSTQVVVAQAQSSDSHSRRKQLDEAMAKGASADTLSDVLNNPVIQNLKNQLRAAEAKLTEVAARVGSNHPTYLAAATEVEDVKRKLADEMKTVAGSISTTSSIAARREGSLQSALAAQRVRVLEIKKQRDDAAVLVRDVENAQKAYDAAMARVTTTRLESQSTQTNIAVINPARVPTEPSSPKPLLNLALAFVVGCMLAGGLALAAELLNRTARCEEDMAWALDAPVLGRLPRDSMPSRRRLSPGMSRLAGPSTAKG